MNARFNPDMPLLAHMDIVKKISIDTPTFAGIQRTLQRTYHEHSSTSTPACKHIVGHSRTGKSFAAREFESRFPPERTPEGLRKEVIYVQAPVKGTIKGLMEALLEALGDPLWMSGTYSNMLSRLLNLLEKAQTKMIILDEFQHLCDKGQRATLTGATDWLKALVERNTFSLVCVGLPSSRAIIFKSEQLRNRFDSTLEVPVYDWMDAQSRRVFRSVLRAMQQQLAPFELPDMSTPEMALRMFIACGGRIGLLSKILDRAVKDAIWEGRTAIRIEDLADAFSVAVWFADSIPMQGGPFLGSLDLNAAQELCTRSMKLSSEVPHEEDDLQTHMGTLTESTKSMTKSRVKREVARALA